MRSAMYLMGVVAIAGLLSRWPSVRRTTLVGPWAWLLLSLAAMPFGCGQADAPRLLAASLTLCPGMALLGAKRPQDRAWHFIVVSFWVVLALPGLQSLLAGRDTALDIHPARGWFLVAWVGFCALNSLFGRYWLSVLWMAAGQTLLLSPFLPWPLTGLPADWPEAGWICVAAAVVAGWFTGGRPRPRASLDELWREFRDAFGAVWTLRMAERLNATARQNGWPLAVGWDGFERIGGEPPLAGMTGEQRRAFRQSFSNLLRRFVDEDWLARRWNGDEARCPADE